MHQLHSSLGFGAYDLHEALDLLILPKVELDLPGHRRSLLQRSKGECGVQFRRQRDGYLVCGHASMTIVIPPYTKCRLGKGGKGVAIVRWGVSRWGPILAESVRERLIES